MAAHDALDEFLANCVADCVEGRPLPGKLGTIDAAHYHLLDGGIEFEDADGVFVHVMLDEGLVSELVHHLSDRSAGLGYLLKKPA